MQKIVLESKNVPTDVQSFQVCSSTSRVLNRDESLSVLDGLKNDRLDSINPEGIQPEYAQGLKTNKVYVLTIESKTKIHPKPKGKGFLFGNFMKLQEKKKKNEIMLNVMGVLNDLQ